MIVVKVELWSAITREKTEIARMTITNTGVQTNKNLGDYVVKAFRGRDKVSLDKSMMKDKPFRHGEIVNHPRLAQHVWNLIAKALTVMDFGK